MITRDMKRTSGRHPVSKKNDSTILMTLNTLINPIVGVRKQNDYSNNTSKLLLFTNNMIIP